VAEVVRASLKNLRKRTRAGSKGRGTPAPGRNALRAQRFQGHRPSPNGATRADPLHERSPLITAPVRTSRRAQYYLLSVQDVSSFCSESYRILSAATPLISTSQSTKQPELRFRPLLSSTSAQSARFSGWSWGKAPQNLHSRCVPSPASRLRFSARRMRS
jgi:hypothetical protein